MATTMLDALSTGKASPQEVVQSVNSHVLADESKKDDVVWETWVQLFSIAGKTPPKQQGGLVEFLEVLRNSPLKNADGEDVVVEQGALWTKLPAFGWVARDLWNWDIHDPKATAQEHEDWDNKAAFLARLTAQASPEDKDDPFNYSLYALWALRDAFEQDSPGSVTNVPAIRNAAIWAIYAGKVLRKLSSEQVNADGNSGAAGPKFAGKEWKGFNPERYNIWKQGFEEAAGSVEAAKAAVEAMENLG
ncbi:uncharacterized protein DNG_07036 [Cephalotrichum gorgonifer]|uniref:Uncharacterized protein n=1 Tax=Cephalotrichum gorgonifer TaxID=2041049 RepID=A0AAE8SX06_9PEZI|nr:uncharacterized protein DNG_07036 [Cephalotrichum gorgonifer]